MEVVSYKSLCVVFHCVYVVHFAAQFSLGNKPWQPCYVARLEGITVMMDCALDLSVLLNFLPLPLVYRYVVAKQCHANAQSLQLLLYVQSKTLQPFLLEAEEPNR